MVAPGRAAVLDEWDRPSVDGARRALTTSSEGVHLAPFAAAAPQTGASRLSKGWKLERLVRQAVRPAHE
jgi:hypothetical protein